MTPPDTVQQMVSATEIKAKELKEAGDWSRAAGCWASLGHHLNDIQLRNSSLFCFQQSLLLKVDPQVVYSFSQCYSVLGNRHAQMMVLEYYASLNTRGFNHVQALYQLGRYSLALKACGYCDAEPAVSMYIGLCCVKLGDLKQAIPSFNEAIEGYNPRDVNDEWSPTILNSAVYKELGLISLEAGDMSGYSEFMAKAHDINPCIFKLI